MTATEKLDAVRRAMAGNEADYQAGRIDRLAYMMALTLYAEQEADLACRSRSEAPAEGRSETRSGPTPARR